MKVVINGAVVEMDTIPALVMIASGAATRYTEPMEAKHTKPYEPLKTKATQTGTRGRSRKAGRTGSRSVAVTDKTNL